MNLLFQRKEEFLRQKELANSHLAWEKKLKEEESKKLMKLRSLEEEMLLKNEQSEIVSRNNIEKQVNDLFLHFVIFVG